MKMSEKQVNDLPEEILLQVFEYLDFKTLLESSLVCQNWNEIIGENSSIMKKMKLDVNVLCHDVQMLPEKFTRKYQRINICKLTGSENIWKLLEQQAPHLKNLEVDRCRVKEEEMGNLKKFFASLTKLETLRIRFSNCYIDLTHLNQLKSLVLDHCYIQKFPEAAQLRNLKIIFVKDYSSELISFLASQKKLEDLTMNHCEATLVTNDNFKKLRSIRFPLKKLSLDGYNLFGLDEYLLLFMNKFVESLEELVIGNSFPASMYEIIFNKFRHLKTLNVYTDCTPKKDSFFFNLQQNLSVEKLKIDDYKPDVVTMKAFIGKLQNLQTLILPNANPSRELMKFIANNLKKLKDLQVSDISDQTFDGLSIPSLRKIRIMYLGRIKSKDWKQIMKALPNIEEFEVEGFTHENLLNEENAKIISEGWPNLKRVKFGYYFVASKKIFDQFLSNCKDLKSVEIYEDAFKSDEEKEKFFAMLNEMDSDS